MTNFLKRGNDPIDFPRMRNYNVIKPLKNLNNVYFKSTLIYKYSII